MSAHLLFFVFQIFVRVWVRISVRVRPRAGVWVRFRVGLRARIAIFLFLRNNVTAASVKKRSSVRFCPFLCSNFLPKLQRGGGVGGMPQFCILFYANYTILASQRGVMAPCPP